MARKPNRADSQAALAHPEDRRDASRRARAEIEFDEQAVLGALFGEFDANLVQIENRLGVYIGARGNKVIIEGSEDAVARARDVLKAMHERLLTGQELDAGAIESLIAMSGEPTLEGIISGETKAPADHDPHPPQDHRAAQRDAERIHARSWRARTSSSRSARRAPARPISRSRRRSAS